MVINGKCHVCRTLKDHKFSQCLSVECLCQCVREIYKMSQNLNEDDIAVEHPLFLEVSAPEVLSLPNKDWEIQNFSRVQKSEWIDKEKKDGRRKKTSNLDYWGDKI